MVKTYMGGGLKTRGVGGPTGPVGTAARGPVSAGPAGVVVDPAVLAHRFRNDLQAVASLLHVQARRAVGEEARLALTDLTARFEALAAACDAREGGAGPAMVDLRAHLGALAGHLRALYDPEGRRAMVLEAGAGDAAVATLLMVPPERAAAAGRALTELVMNAHRHAFPDRHEGGAVRVGVEADGAGGAVLTVADDGEGLAREPGRGIGLALVEGLARELSGAFTLTSWHGVEARLAFPLERPDGALPQPEAALAPRAGAA